MGHKQMGPIIRTVLGTGIWKQSNESHSPYHLQVPQFGANEQAT